MLCFRFLRKCLPISDKDERQATTARLLKKHLRHFFLVFGPLLPDPILERAHAITLCKSANLDEILGFRQLGGYSSYKVEDFISEEWWSEESSVDNVELAHRFVEEITFEVRPCNPGCAAHPPAFACTHTHQRPKAAKACACRRPRPPPRLTASDCVAVVRAEVRGPQPLVCDL